MTTDMQEICYVTRRNDGALALGFSQGQFLVAEPEEPKEAFAAETAQAGAEPKERTSQQERASRRRVHQRRRKREGKALARTEAAARLSSAADTPDEELLLSGPVPPSYVSAAAEPSEPDSYYLCDRYRPNSWHQAIQYKGEGKLSPRKIEVSSSILLDAAPMATLSKDIDSQWISQDYQETRASTYSDDSKDYQDTTASSDDDTFTNFSTNFSTNLSTLMRNTMNETAVAAYAGRDSWGEGKETIRPRMPIRPSAPPGLADPEDLFQPRVPRGPRGLPDPEDFVQPRVPIRPPGLFVASR